MDLGLQGQTIQHEHLGYTFILTFTGSYEITIENTITLNTNTGTYHLVPDETTETVAQQLRTLVEHHVTSSAADDTGNLRLTFANGTQLHVAPDDTYEAWTLTGPRDLRIACMPGGELAIWSPHNSSR